MAPLSRAEVVACVGACVVLALVFVPDAGPVLEYRQAQVVSEPWRLLTAHVVHINLRHALVNAAAWCLIARLFASDLGASRQMLALLSGCVGIGIGLFALLPEVAWYRGLSGALHALFFCGTTVRLGTALLNRARAAVWIPVVLAVGGWAKVLHEQPPGNSLPYAEWLGAATVPQAHLIGAICGTLLGLAWLARDRRGRFSRRDVS